MRACVPVASASVLAALLSLSVHAHADPTCTSVDGFNDAMSAAGGATTSITLKYDVTGVNPADYAGSKGCLVDFENIACMVGSGIAGTTLKVYGTYDPPNLSHPAGTLKFEYFNECCATPPCQEGWADPGTSDVVFSDGTEQCSVTAYLDAAHYGYSIDCGGGKVFEAVGDNVNALTVDRVAILKLFDGGWEMPNATATNVEVCYEPPAVPPGAPMTMKVPVLADAAVSPATPDSVVTPIEDLSLGTSDGEIFLKFDLGSVPGKITKAQMFLHQSDVTSAAGDGGDAFAVPDVSWSEATLTYSGRPATTGSSLARQAPISAFDWYAWDVSAAIQKAGVYAFALVPEATDANGAHFFSKEGSTSLAPYMQVAYSVVDADGDGYPDGPDCNDASAAVHPGAMEVCNGIDDDCNGIVDDGCPGSPSGGATSGSGAGDPAGNQGVAFSDETTGGGQGCGCRVPREESGTRGAGWIAIAIGAMAVARGRGRGRKR